MDAFATIVGITAILGAILYALYYTFKRINERKAYERKQREEALRYKLKK